ncbi:MAG: 30S ribosomal protein S10 [bacterium]|nr:30S ribosomal protein S10 [bacterium]
MAEVIIHLASPNLELLNKYVENVKRIAERTGARCSIVMLPTRRIRKSVRKSPCSRGTPTFELWELRIHKRLIKLKADARTINSLTRLPISEELQIRMKIIQ